MKNLLFILLLFSSPLFAQATLQGTITDSKGSPIPGVNIILQNGDLQKGTAGNADGSFIIKDLEAGKYLVKVSAVGYAPYEGSIDISGSGNFRLNISLAEKAIETEQVVASASKYSQQIKDLPISAVVMPGSAIRDKVINDLDEALRYIPGVSMTLDQVSIRGSSGYARGVGSRVVTALDGFPMYSGDTGEIIWEIFPVNIIERIEVIKGAASSIYGSNAIGGVINVISGQGRANETYIRMNGGFYSQPDEEIWKWSSGERYFRSMSVTQKLNFSAANLVVSLTQSDNDGYRKDDDYRRNSFFVKSEIPLTTGSSLTLLANGLQMNRGNFLYWKDSRNVLVPRDAESGQRVGSDRYFGGILYKNAIGANLLISNRVSYYHTDWADQSSASNTSKTGLFRNDLSVDYQINEQLNTITGVELLSGKTEANIFGNRTAKGAGVYMQSEYKGVEKFIFSAGFRYDYFKPNDLSAKSAFSPKAGVNFKATDDVVLRFSAGTGFRAPSLAELYTNTNVGGLIIKPNPALESETVFNLELGGNYNFDAGHSVDISFFSNDYKNFIEPALDPADGQVRFANLSDASIAGAEISFSNKIPFLALDMQNSFMYLDTKDKGKDKEMKYRPKYSFNSALRFSFGKFSVDYDFRYWSRVAEIDNDLITLGLVKDGDKRTEVYLSHISAGYNLSGFNFPAKLSVAVKNVFNYNYVEMIGNLSPLRSFTLNLEVLF